MTTDTSQELTAAELATVVMPFLQDAATQIYGAINQLGGLVQQALDSRIVCFQCFGDHTAAQRAGITGEHLPPVNVANLIVDGKGVCHNHVRVGGGIILPGQV